LNERNKTKEEVSLIRRCSEKLWEWFERSWRRNESRKLKRGTTQSLSVTVVGCIG